MNIKVFATILSNVGNYELDGKILSLPIQGIGKINTTFGNYYLLPLKQNLIVMWSLLFSVNAMYKYRVNYEIKKGKNNNDYINIIDNQLRYTLERAHFTLENLFNNKQLCKNCHNI